MENKIYHKPVLIQEVLEYLNPQPGKVYIDATFGGGGHTRAILQKEPKCSVIAIDWDMVAFEHNREKIEQEFPGRVRFIWGNFAHLLRLLKKEKIDKVDGILADFGTSKFQIHQRPGFSFNQDTFLDMRMSPGHQKLTAGKILNTFVEKDIADILFEYGEERQSRKIARKIVEERAKKYIKTTGDLVKIIESIIPRRGRIHPATKTFQALRIVVNRELENISTFLKASMQVVRPGGRIVCISFHSLEDRIVKQFFKQQTIGRDPLLEILTRKVVKGTPEEIEINPSARSARLRAAEIL